MCLFSIVAPTRLGQKKVFSVKIKYSTSLNTFCKFPIFIKKIWRSTFDIVRQRHQYSSWFDHHSTTWTHGRQHWMDLSTRWSGQDHHLPLGKQEDSSSINQFHQINLLNVEGKIFFSVVGHWSIFLMKNNYIDSSVQKAGRGASLSLASPARMVKKTSTIVTALNSQPQIIPLIQEGEKQWNKPSPSCASQLDRARDWKMCVDLHQKLTFPIWNHKHQPASRSDSLVQLQPLCLRHWTDGSLGGCHQWGIWKKEAAVCWSCSRGRSAKLESESVSSGSGLQGLCGLLHHKATKWVGH